MKIFYIAIAAVSLSLTSCNSSKIAYKHYGPVAVDSTQALTLDEMLLKFKAQPQNDVFTFAAPLVAVCHSAGG